MDKSIVGMNIKQARTLDVSPAELLCIPTINERVKDLETELDFQNQVFQTLKMEQEM